MTARGSPRPSGPSPPPRPRRQPSHVRGTSWHSHPLDSESDCGGRAPWTPPTPRATHSVRPTHRISGASREVDARANEPEKNVSATKVAAGVVCGAAAAVAGSKLVQKVVGEAGKALGVDPEQPNRATQTLTVSASADELFGFFRDAANFQRVLRNVVEVQPAGERSLQWKVSGPDGHDLELNAQLTEERPGELLRWTPGGDGGSSAELEVRLRPSPVGAGTAV